jgi:hypothetical protein
MKKVLITVGIIILVIVIGLVALVFFGAKEDEVARSFSEKVATEFTQNWDFDVIEKYASPELLDIMNSDQASKNQLLSFYKQAGQVTEIGDFVGQATTKKMIGSDAVTTAEYVADIKFTNTEGNIFVKTRKIDSEWKLDAINIEFPPEFISKLSQ